MAPAQVRSQVKPEDLSRLSIPTDPRVTTDGSSIAFEVWTPDVDSDENRREIWVHRDGSASRFTKGPSDTMPRWSPDGSHLAFLRRIEGTGPQVAVMPSNGGEAEIISDFAHGVEDLEWSPDGQSLLAVAVTPLREWQGLDDDERGRKPRRIDSVPYRYDDLGWTHDRRRHLWLLDPEGTEEPHCLTPGDFDEESPAWSPDGKKVAFVSERSANKGLVRGNHIWEVDVETSELTRATDRGYWVLPSYSPTGVLHALGNTDFDFPIDSYLCRREPDGSMTILTGHLDRSALSLAAGRPTVRWDSEDALIGIEDSGAFGVIRVSPDARVSCVVEGRRVVTGFDVSGSTTFFTSTSWDSPGELFETDGQAETRITHLYTGDLDLVEPDHFRVNNGRGEIDVWVVLPEDGDSVPLLLNVHGGPASQYGFGFFDEFQVYAGAGYGVVACNPRGSSGRGIEHNRAVVGEGWGEVDYQDIRSALTDAIERHPRLDPDRMGVMGGSYGGFMAAWIIGREDRWSSAIVERALLSWTSFSGTSDIGGLFPEYYTEAAYPEAWGKWWDMSPLSIAHQVSTPTLIIHSENDFRCPIEQAEQFFMALVRNGTPVEFVRFPNEGHEMSRSGSPRHRLERFEAILDWHERHLR